MSGRNGLYTVLTDLCGIAVCGIEHQIHVRAKADELLHNVLIAALNVLNVLNLRHAMRSKTGNDHRRARTQVSRTHRCTLQGLVLICFVLPAVLSFAFDLIFRKIGWVKDGDMKIDA